MQILNAWAIRWQIPPQAVDELRRLMTAVPESQSMVAMDSEAAAQVKVRLAASQLGWKLWRNNVGVLRDDRGVPIRYGLANDSHQMNMQIKSSDLIGLTDQGQFVALEVKRPGWRYTGTNREKAQLKFIEMVNAMGGYARFSTGEL